MIFTVNDLNSELHDAKAHCAGLDQELWSSAVRGFRDSPRTSLGVTEQSELMGRSRVSYRTSLTSLTGKTLAYWLVCNFPRKNVKTTRPDVVAWIAEKQNRLEGNNANKSKASLHLHDTICTQHTKALDNRHSILKCWKCLNYWHAWSSYKCPYL